MTGSQHFSPGDIQFQLVYDRGQCDESSYLKVQELVQDVQKILMQRCYESKMVKF